MSLSNKHQGLLVVDHQVGLFHLVRDMTAVEFHNALLAHAALAEVFELPIVMTTSAEKGI
jgi:nicotinamidase-related amidase